MNASLLLPVASTYVDELTVSPDSIAVRPRGALPARLVSLMRDQGDALATTAAGAWRLVADYTSELYAAHRRACASCTVDVLCPAASMLLAIECEARTMDGSKETTPEGVVFRPPQDPVLRAALQRFLEMEELLDNFEAVDGQGLDPDERALFVATWLFDQACLADCQHYLQLAREAGGASTTTATASAPPAGATADGSNHQEAGRCKLCGQPCTILPEGATWRVTGCRCGIYIVTDFSLRQYVTPEPQKEEERWVEL